MQDANRLDQPNTKSNSKQQIVDDFFDNHSKYWKETYEGKDIFGVIYKRRQETALKYVDDLRLPKTAHVLEIGCGAGFMTAALARRGFMVEAIDHSQAMVDLTREQLKEKGIVNRIRVCTGDIHELSYGDQTFDLIIALGVVPWLHNLNQALCEIALRLKNGGLQCANNG